MCEDLCQQARDDPNCMWWIVTGHESYNYTAAQEITVSKAKKGTLVHNKEHVGFFKILLVVHSEWLPQGQTAVLLWLSESFKEGAFNTNDLDSGNWVLPYNKASSGHTESMGVLHLQQHSWLSPPHFSPKWLPAMLFFSLKWSWRWRVAFWSVPSMAEVLEAGMFFAFYD